MSEHRDRLGALGYAVNQGIQAYASVHKYIEEQGATAKSALKNLFGRGTSMSQLLDAAKSLVPMWVDIESNVLVCRAQTAFLLDEDEQRYLEALSEYVTRVRAANCGGRFVRRRRLARSAVDVSLQRSSALVLQLRGRSLSATMLRRIAILAVFAAMISFGSAHAGPVLMTVNNIVFYLGDQLDEKETTRARNELIGTIVTLDFYSQGNIVKFASPEQEEAFICERLQDGFTEDKYTCPSESMTDTTLTLKTLGAYVQSGTLRGPAWGGRTVTVDLAR